MVLDESVFRMIFFWNLDEIPNPKHPFPFLKTETPLPFLPFSKNEAPLRLFLKRNTHSFVSKRNTLPFSQNDTPFPFLTTKRSSPFLKNETPSLSEKENPLFSKRSTPSFSKKDPLPASPHSEKEPAPDPLSQPPF